MAVINARTNYEDFFERIVSLKNRYLLHDRRNSMMHQLVTVAYSEYARREINLDTFLTLPEERRLAIAKKAYAEFSRSGEWSAPGCKEYLKGPGYKGRWRGCGGKANPQCKARMCACTRCPVHTLYYVTNRYNGNVLQFGQVCIERFERSIGVPAAMARVKKVPGPSVGNRVPKSPSVSDTSKSSSTRCVPTPVQSTTSEALRPSVHVYLNGSIYGNVTVFVGSEVRMSAKRRRVVDVDSDSEPEVLDASHSEPENKRAKY